jgi:hypothetical protein
MQEHGEILMLKSAFRDAATNVSEEHDAQEGMRSLDGYIEAPGRWWEAASKSDAFISMQDDGWCERDLGVRDGLEHRVRTVEQLKVCPPLLRRVFAGFVREYICDQNIRGGSTSGGVAAASSSSGKGRLWLRRRENRVSLGEEEQEGSEEKKRTALHMSTS